MTNQEKIICAVERYDAAWTSMLAAVENSAKELSRIGRISKRADKREKLRSLALLRERTRLIAEISKWVKP